MSNTEYYCTCGQHHKCDRHVVGHCNHASSSKRCGCKEICGKPDCYCIPIHLRRGRASRIDSTSVSAKLIYCSKLSCFNPGIMVEEKCDGHSIIVCAKCSSHSPNESHESIKKQSFFGCSVCAKTHQKYYVLQTKKLICETCKNS